MPDLATHALLSFAGIRVYGLVNRKRSLDPAMIYLFVMGNVFPDLLDKTMPYALHYLYPDTTIGISLFYLHTPAMLLISIYMFSLFFEEVYRKKTFLVLTTGGGFHLVLDMLQGNVCGTGYMWFFPFSSVKPEVMNLFYDDTTTPLIPLFMVFVAVVELIHRKITSGKA